MSHKLSVLLLLATLALSCNHTPAKEENDPRVSIMEMEEQMEDDVTIDTALAIRLTNAYINFAENNPKDSSSPYYLNRAADILKEIPGKQLKAVNLYNDIFVRYPDHPLAARGVFMVGFVFDEKYHDVERASKSYRFFLSNFPDHPLAGDAKNLLAMLQDTTSEELEQIHRWMQSDSTKDKE